MKFNNNPRIWELEESLIDLRARLAQGGTPAVREAILYAISVAHHELETLYAACDHGTLTRSP